MKHAMLAVGLGLALASTAVAQEVTTGSIGGQVSDPQGLSLPGVSVTVTSGQGTQTFTTDDQGRFYAPFLTPGIYSVRAELSGFKPVEQRRIEVRLGQRAELTLKLEVGAISETVEVTGGSAIVDVTSTTVGANIDSDMLARIPVQRQLSDTLYLAPGVSSGGGTGRANPSVGGASGLENQYVVDGVNITNPGYGALGSYSIVLGSLGTGVTFDFIQEVQVKTAGYEAQYGQATGGVVNVVTKSGTNQLRGTVFGYVQPAGLQGTYTPVLTSNASRVEAVNTVETQQSDVGAEGGGPVVQNRLFYFAAIDPQWTRTQYQAPIGFPLRDAPGVDTNRDRRILAYSTKGTWQVTAAHRIDASFFGDPGNGPSGPQRQSALLRTDTSGYSKLDNFGGHNQTVRYSGILRPNWLLEAAFARSSNGITEVPSQNTFSYEDLTTTPITRTGGIGFYENNDGVNKQFQAFGTNLLPWLGNHQLRYGVQYENIDYNNITNYSGTPFTLSNGQTTVTGASVSIMEDDDLGQIYRVTRSNLDNVRSTRQDYLSFFAQDTWRFHRLTLRPGVRYEQQKLVGNLANYTFDGNWAPRLGITFDPTGQGRMKLFANYGRFFAKIPNDLAARALSADAGVSRADYFDKSLTEPIPEGVTAGGTTRHLILAGLSPSTFDPNARSTFSNEIVTGAEWEAFPGLSLAARYTHRTYGRVLEDVGTAPMAAYFLLPASELSSVEYFITNPGTKTPVTSTDFTDQPIGFENAVHDYNAFEVEADRRFSHNWSLQASYRYSRTTGNFEGFFRNDNGQSDPGITSLFDFPTNDPTYVSLGRDLGFRGDIRFLGSAGIGPLPNDRRHQGKVYGNYLFGFGVNVGIGLNLSSGRPLTALAANPVYDTPGEIPETPRGQGFQTEQGFKKRTPVESEFDLHADYNWRLFGARGVTLLADVFNLTGRQGVRDYDDFTESTFGAENPDFGRILAYQTPRTVRFGVRVQF
jgi:hypothetical protein